MPQTPDPAGNTNLFCAGGSLLISRLVGLLQGREGGGSYWGVLLGHFKVEYSVSPWIIKLIPVEGQNLRKLYCRQGI